MSEKSTMQLLLEARFQQLAEDQEEKNSVPSELRKEVFRTLDVIDMVGEIGDLFTGKFGSTTAEFIDLIESPDNNVSPVDSNNDEATAFDPADF